VRAKWICDHFLYLALPLCYWFGLVGGVLACCKGKRGAKIMKSSVVSVEE
jgi:hypothetical protein